MRYLLRLPAILLASAVALLSGCSSGDDNNDARVRLLNVSTGYPALDFYVTEEDADTDDLKSSNVVFGTLGDYVSVPSGTYDIKYKRAGVGSTLLTNGDQQLADDSNATYVFSGPVGRFAATAIPEDIEEPDDDGISIIRSLNASEAGGVDIYLTDPDLDLNDTAPVFAGTDGSTTYESGTYRLRITGPNDISDLRLDVPSITLDENTVATLILTETSGGVLVDALLLPQQGSLTTFKNTKARIRGAVGVLPGSTATLGVAGTQLFINRGVGFISDYAEVEAGSVAVTLGVGGTPVTVANQTLVAGADYTLLLWNDASGVRVTLVSDDNHLPTNKGKTKIRLLNGYSTQSDSLNLLVNFGPVTEGTAVGAASIYAEVDSGTDQRIDVESAVTTNDLYTNESADFDQDAVYTLFITAASGGNAQAALRQDR
ncbi:MAG TPA: DUF4397 domain-containing protein [Steroidobacter sp.]|uniref:DUF4397 domain-containing protein n=1 Tax=Steroidobacter sp. TaxID=1978227 RepID=UPI002ED9CE63